eukprot:34854-Ditylum_brightwellii.AAC.1
MVNGRTLEVEKKATDGHITGVPVLGMVCTREGKDILIGIVKEGGGEKEITEENSINGSTHSIFIGGNTIYD